MNEKTTAAPKDDSLRDLIGQAISDEIAAGAEQPDWCDSREIDRLADAVMAVLAKRRTTLSPELRAALDGAAKIGATMAEVPGGGLVFINRGGEQLEDGRDLNCPACGGSGHADDARSAAAPARAAEPSTAQGDALSQQAAPSAQQERAWFKHWLAGLDGNITVDQVEFGRRVWAERARRAADGGV